MYSLTQLSIKQLFLKDISHRISQLHVSARSYGAMAELLRKVLYTINNVLFGTRSRITTDCIFEPHSTSSIMYFTKYITRSRTKQNIVNCIHFLKARPEDGSRETSRNT